MTEQKCIIEHAYPQGNIRCCCGMLIAVEQEAHYHDDFIVRYGVQSTYEKLNLLFPEKYRIAFK